MSQGDVLDKMYCAVLMHVRNVIIGKLKEIQHPGSICLVKFKCHMKF